MKEKTQKTTRIAKLKDEKQLILYEINEFLNKKTVYVGFKDEKQITKKYNSKMALLQNNPAFKKAFNNSTLKVVKIDNKNGGTRTYV